MKVKLQVVEALNNMLVHEMTAFHQYTAHARVCKDWGLRELADVINNRAGRELQDAHRIADMILMYEGRPAFDQIGEVTIAISLREQFKCDLEMEQEAIKLATEGVTICDDSNAYHARALFEEIVGEEEEHAHWLETQLTLMNAIGPERYIAEYIN